MDTLKSYTVFLFLIIQIAYTCPLIVAQENQVTRSLSQLKQISSEMNQQLLPLLALIKEYEKSQPATTFKVAKITRPFAAVRETDNANSRYIAEVRMNEEFLIIGEGDRWYKIKTRDTREGWISEDDIQIILKQTADAGTSNKDVTKQESAPLLAQMARYKNRIDELNASAGLLMKQTEEYYNGLPNEKKQALASDYQSFIMLKEKIGKYNGYVTRFLGPYENVLNLQNASQPSRVAPGDRFKGTAMADIGRSSYKNMGSNSTTSSRLAFEGIYQIDPSLRAEAAIRHQNELIQTPFSNTTIDAGISKQFADKLQLNGNLGYERYDDKTSATNTFGLLNSGINVMYRPSRKSTVYGNVNFRSKGYTSSQNNNFQGVFYTIGTTFSPEETQSVRFQVLGTYQYSQNDYLSFYQINPQLNYVVKKSPKKSLDIGLDADFLTFASLTSSGDYRKYSMQLLWRNNRSKKTLTKNLNLTYKSFPYNTLQDYVRIAYTLQRRKGSLTGKGSSSSTFSSTLNYLVQRADMVTTDQLELRWDKSRTGPAGYSNINIFSRMWNNFEKTDSTSFDNVIDFYTEFGPNMTNLSQGTVSFTRLKIGLTFGGHVFYNFSKLYVQDEQPVEENNPMKDTFFRNGSSIRGGIAISSAFKIKNASLELNGIYEKSLVLQKQSDFINYLGVMVYGDNITRSPSSFQFRIDFRLPVYQNWDIHFNLSSYNIRTDATIETSINPVIEKKSNVRFSGGLIYRFSL